MSRAPSTAFRLPVRLLVLLLVVNLVLGACHTLSYTGVIESESFRRLFDLNGEANPPAWYSGTLLFLIALGSAVHAQLLRQRGEAGHRLFFGLAAWFLFLSASEVGMIHETLNRMLERRVLQSEGFFSEKRHVGLITFAAYAAAGGVLLVLCWRDALAAAQNPVGRRWILGGCVTFATGAVLVDAWANVPEFLRYSLEEVLELTGIAMILCGFVARIGPRILLQLEGPGESATMDDEPSGLGAACATPRPEARFGQRREND